MSSEELGRLAEEVRAERIDVLKEEGRWDEEAGPFGLPKVAHRKANVGVKDKKAPATEEEKPAEEEAK